MRNVIQIIWQLISGEGLEVAGVVKGRLPNSVKWSHFFSK